MQDVNNDMDDLFRRAADEYPLKTDSAANWDKVFAGLNSVDAPIAVTINKKSNNKRRALWLLLLLPLSSLYLLLHNVSETKNASSVAIKSAKHNSIKTNHNNAISEIQPSTNHFSKADNNSAVIGYYKTQKFNKNKTGILGTALNVSKQNADGDRHLNGRIFLPNEQDKKASTRTSKDNKQNTENVIHNKNMTTEKQPDDEMQRIQNVTEKQKGSDTAEQKKVIASAELGINKKDSAAINAVDKDDNKKVVAKVNTQQQRGFYAGLMGSLDFSTVKFQQIHKAGYSLSFLVGDRLSKHISVESGISVSKKYYYSDGKYFDKKKTGIPEQVDIYFTNGTCKMFEIPVNVKYNFAVHKNSSLFATAGLSSYFMKKESYGYHADWNGWVYDTARQYKNSGTNLLSVVNFSVGYQLRVNKATTLRIEPYLKVPLKGIGIANMPIMSTGISVGFTRSF